MAHTIPRNSPGNDSSSLSEKTPQETDVFEIDGRFLLTESAITSPRKPPSSLHSLPPPLLSFYFLIKPRLFHYTGLETRFLFFRKKGY